MFVSIYNISVKSGCKSGKSTMLFLLLRTMMVLGVVAAMPVNSAPVNSETQAMIYLAQFGYLNPNVKNPSSGALIDEDTWMKAISEFQAFAGLNVTGQLDDETRRLMSSPRCGVKDKVGFGSDSRSKRYALQGSRWKVKDLTYKISKYPRKLVKADVDKEIARAFNVWAEYTDLTFAHRKSGQVHIEIRFERGEHGDGDPFDGPGGTLAHAYFPVYGGDAHFDDSENWTIGSYRGTNLFQVAAHEFGHSLGLSHSDVRSALMAPFYRGYDPIFNLDSDDIQGIQALYGKKTRQTSITTDYDGSDTKGNRRTTDNPETVQDPELCNDAKIDAMFNSADGVTYAFKGDYYFKLTEDGIAKNYPKLISKSWIGLPGNIDAAFTYKNGKTYFFKGTQYWRYAGKKMEGDYPKQISEGFTGIPDNVDAALVWSGNGKIYFYKGTKFWRFDPSQRPPVKSTYPKPLSNWEGVPDNVDAALHYTNGYTYFFKGGSYYRFNDRSFSVDRADPAFPRATAYWWFGCKSASKGTIGKLNFWSGHIEDKSLSDDNDHDDRHGDVSDLILDAAGPNDRDNPTHDAGKDKPASSSTHRTVAPLSLIGAMMLFLIT